MPKPNKIAIAGRKRALDAAASAEQLERGKAGGRVPQEDDDDNDDDDDDDDGDEDNYEGDDGDGDEDEDGGDNDDDGDGDDEEEEPYRPLLLPLPDELRQQLNAKCLIPCQTQAWPLPAQVTAPITSAMTDRDGFDPNLVNEMTKFTQPEHRRYCYKPVTEDEGEEPLPRTVSKFGGKPYLLKHETRGVQCGDCNKAMSFFLQIYGDDLPEHLRSVFVPESLRGADQKALFQFWCCLRCNSFDGNPRLCRPRWIDAAQPSIEARNDSEFSLNEDGGQLVAKPTKLIEWSQQDDRPDSFEATEIWQVDYPVDDDTADGLFQPVDGEKLSGFPLWIQNVEYGACPQCGARNELFFQIHCDHIFRDVWGTGCARVLVCPQHRDQLRFGWAC